MATRRIMRDTTFACSVDVVGETFKFSQEAIAAEPMVFSADVKFARENGGTLTRSVLDLIESLPGWYGEVLEYEALGYRPVIDTKSVLLQKGQYPCIPGWHCDGVERKDGESQPDLNTVNDPIGHYVLVSGGDGTEFVTEPHLTIPVEYDRVWGSVNEQVEAAEPRTWQAKPNFLVRFNRSQLHRGPVATEAGWRYFFRLSFYNMPARNEIRRQVQVYADPSVGW